jgi:cytochrome c oxidase assembly factor CtaG
VLLAHVGQPPQPHDLWQAWSWAPGLLLNLLLIGWLYARGAGALGRRAAASRRLARWRAAAFWSGLAVLGLALVSPLEALGTALFSAHMLQHMLLILAAAPLLVAGAPERVLIWALRPADRRRVGGWWPRIRPLRTLLALLALPAVAWALHGLALWAWHAPGLYQAALANEAVHLLEHVSLFGTALLFWWPVWPGQGRARLEPPLAALYLFTFSLQGGLLGALMTFARTPWYPAYADTTAAWGLSPLDDQQLAGLIMWIPAGLVYILAGLAILGRWLSAAEAVDAAEVVWPLAADRRASGSTPGAKK